MRLCFVSPRYGEDVPGGAEQLARMFAERTAARGHSVTVATTCARSHVDWADASPPGRSEIAGVTVHRFPVARPRDYAGFDALNLRMATGIRRRPTFMQEEWMRAQGPWTPALEAWLGLHASGFDCVICVPYLYWTTRAVLRTVPGRSAVLMHPAIHDEAVLQMSIFDRMFRATDAFALSTPEEVDLIRSRFGFTPRGAVVGIGIEAGRGDGARFRADRGLGDAPYLCYVGRVQAAKGAGELVDFFVAYKERHPGSDLRLVLVGEPLLPVPERDDIVVTGFVDDVARDDAVAGALALVMPSYYESFSIVLADAFARGRPALVQAACPALAGQARRSAAAIPYRGFAAFEVAVDELLGNPDLADAMGAAGREYVRREYDWEVVLDRYDALLAATVRGEAPLAAGSA